MSDSFDRELLAAFDELRTADASSAPVFVVPPRKRLAPKLVWAAVAAAAVLIVAATLVLRRQPEPAPMDITQWRAPSDVLLQMR